MKRIYAPFALVIAALLIGMLSARAVFAQEPVTVAPAQQEAAWSGTVTKTTEHTRSRNTTGDGTKTVWDSGYRYVETYTIVGPAGDDPNHVMVQVSAHYEVWQYSFMQNRSLRFANPENNCYGYATRTMVSTRDGSTSLGGVFPFAIGIRGTDVHSFGLSPLVDIPRATFTEKYQYNETDVWPCGSYADSDSDTRELSVNLGRGASTKERHPMPDGSRFTAFELDESEHVDGDSLVTNREELTVSVTRKPLRLRTAEIQHELYPSRAWRNAATGLVDGNPARVYIEVEELRQASNVVSLEVIDEESGRMMFRLLEHQIAPNQSEPVTFEFGTTGLAFKADGSAREELRLKVRLLEGANEVDSRSLTVPLLPKPVMLVHGLWSDPSAWSSYPGFLKSVHPNWVGVAVTGMNTGSLSASGVTTDTNTIAQNAAIEAQQIEAVRREHNAWQVDVVAHSMGGLITRKYMQSMPRTANDLPAIAHLVMLGTPNQGSPCANLVTAMQARVLNKVVAAPLELMPSTVALFNVLNSRTNGTHMSIAAGEIMPLTCYERTGGDGVVTVPSAYHVFTDRGLQSILHTSMGGDRTLFDTFVKPRLALGRDVVAGTQMAAEQDALTILPDIGSAGAAEEMPPLIYTNAITISGSKTEAMTVTVPTADALGLMVSTNQTYSITLTAPDGTQAWAQRTGADAAYQGMRWTRIETPQAGMWTIRLRNVSNDPTPALIGVWLEGGNIALQPAATAPAIMAGADVTAAEASTSNVPVTITARDGAAALTGQSISAMVAGDGVLQTITLLDDGAHGDGAANDGVYGGTFENLPDGVYWWGATLNSGGMQYHTSHSFVLGSEPMPDLGSGMPTVFLPMVDR